jgi:hypothetical protein
MGMCTCVGCHRQNMCSVLASQSQALLHNYYQTAFVIIHPCALHTCTFILANNPLRLNCTIRHQPTNRAVIGVLPYGFPFNYVNTPHVALLEYCRCGGSSFAGELLGVSRGLPDGSTKKRWRRNRSF